MAIQLSKNGNAVKFDFDNNSHYLFDGTIEVPVNSLTLVTDESDMFTFKKAASDDIFISGLYEEIGMSKSELIAWYKDNMVSTGGGGGVTSGEVETMIDDALEPYAQTTAVTASINAAVSGKADTSTVQNIASDVATVSGDVNTLSGSVNTLTGNVNALSGDVANKADTTAVTASIAEAVSGKQDTLISGTNIKTINNESILGSGNITIEGGGGGGTNVIELTQAQYDALTDIDPDAFYIITDADGGVSESTFTAYTAATDAILSDKADTSAVTASINAAVSGKQDTLVSGTNIKTINNESILGEGNIEIQGGGGKAIVAGRGIAVTTGATADTVSFDLPIWNPSGAHKNITIGSDTNHPNGMASVAVGQANTTNDRCSFVSGLHNILNNENEAGFGCYNNSHTGSTDADKTAFSVGNGTAANARHNAFEIRQNGDIYITKDGSDVKLQDELGGGGVDSGTVQSMIDDSLANYYDADTIDTQLSAITQTTDRIERVTATALNDLNAKLGGMKLVQLTQAQYDALTVKDPQTLYFITNVVN